jgi:putative hydrolase of the HAD superfamily
MERKILAVCFDSGDTIVDEGTEQKDASGAAWSGELIPGAEETLRAVKARGYPMALVADGPALTFHNLLGSRGLLALFDALAISGEVGVEKPDARMFLHALDSLGIAPESFGRVVMVGNNLSRDIKGANALGMVSVWLNWAPRRSKVPADATEAPQFTIRTPLELLGVLDRLEGGQV